MLEDSLSLSLWYKQVLKVLGGRHKHLSGAREGEGKLKPECGLVVDLVRNPKGVPPSVTQSVSYQTPPLSCKGI